MVAKKAKKAAKKPAQKAATKTKSIAKPKGTVKKAALSIKKPYTKSQIMSHLASFTDIKKKEIENLLDHVVHLMEAHLSSKGPGEFNFAGLFKCRVIRKPATKARSGINPFNGQPTVFPAKPARNVLKIRPLKKLKEIVS